MTGPEQHANTVERLAQAFHEAYERLAPFACLKVEPRDGQTPSVPSGP